MVLTIFFFILLIGVLVLVHEFGHFYVAKRFRIRVEEFAFGFPPRLFSIVKNGTRYALNLVPIGGYVKIFGESGEGDGNAESFISRPVWQRFLVIVAGVSMNLVLAWFLFSVTSALGTPTVVTPENQSYIKNPKVGIIDVERESPAENADIRMGDLVVKVVSGGEVVPISATADLQKFIVAHAGNEITLSIERGKERFEKKVVPRISVEKDQGQLGVVLSEIGIVRTPWYWAWWDGLRTLFFTFLATIFGFAELVGNIFRGEGVSQAVSGPVGIFILAKQFTELGLAYFLNLGAALSVNLAILNALPIPALDGGRIFFLLIEKIKGSRVNERFERTTHMIGFALLILLIVAITYHDILTRIL